MKFEGKSLLKTFFNFIIPSIVAQWVFALYTAVDGMFVARGVSEAALTAVNICTPYTMTLFALSIMPAVGASSIAAIRLGEKNIRSAREIFSRNLALLVILSILITVLGLIFLEPLADLLGASDYNRSDVLVYLGTIVPFSAAFIISYSFEMFIKTDGYPQRATLVVTTGVLLNILLDYLMVIRFQMGVFGAALATGISNTVVVLLYLIHFTFSKGVFKLCRFAPEPKTVLRQLKNGLSSGITEFSSAFVVFLFNRMILRFIGAEELVSYTIISYVNSIVVMTMVGLSQGYQPLVGYFRGKQDRASCLKLLKYGLIVTASASVLLGLGSIAGAGAVVGIYLPSDSSLFDYSVRVFRIFSLCFFLSGFNITVSGYFIAIEKAFAATVISLSRSIVMLTASLFLLTALFGGSGIWWGATLSECITLGFTLFFLIRNKNEL